LAPVNCPIADFLAKAPEPPAFLISRNAVHLLKVSERQIHMTIVLSLRHHQFDLLDYRSLSQKQQMGGLKKIEKESRLRNFSSKTINGC